MQNILHFQIQASHPNQPDEQFFEPVTEGFPHQLSLLGLKEITFVRTNDKFFYDRALYFATVLFFR